MATSEHKALFKAEVEGTEELNQMKEAAEGVSSGFRSMGESADDAKSKTASLGDVMKRLESIDLQQKFQSIRGAVMDLSEAIGIEGAGDGLLGRMLQSGAALGELGALMGPQGAVVGSIVGAMIPALQSLMGSHDAAAEAAAAQAEELRNVQRDADAAAEAMRNFQSAQARLARGSQSIGEDDAQALLTRLLNGYSFQNEGEARLAIEVISEQMRQLEGSGGNRDFISGQLDRLNEAMRAAQEALSEFQNAPADPASSPSSGGNRPRTTRLPSQSDAGGAMLRGMGIDRAFEEADYAELFWEDFWSEAQEGQLDFLQTFADESKSATDRAGELADKTREATEAQWQLEEAAKSAADEFRNGWGRSTEDVIAAFEAANEAARKASQIQIEQGELIRESASAVGETVLESIGTDVSKAFAASVAAAIEGAKSFEEVMAGMVKNILSSLLQEAIVQTLRETALGIADVASYKYDSAAAHFAAAGAWVAVGAAAGAGLGAVAASGGGGGGSASAAANAPQENQEAQQTQSITINMTYNNPMYTTQNEADRQLREALNRVNLGR
jgi:hypothetical protein